MFFNFPPKVYLYLFTISLSFCLYSRAQYIKCSLFSGQNGKYWTVRDGGIFADSDLPQGFYLELREPTRYTTRGSI